MPNLRSKNHSVTPGLTMRPAEPLWRLAPTRDDDGRGLADFMMLLPGLTGATPVVRQQVADTVREVFAEFGEAVAFADINCRLNLLWVSVEAQPGLAARVASAVRRRLPDALLVGGQLGAVPVLPVNARWKRWWSTLRRLPSPLRARLPGRRGGPHQS